MQLTGLQRTLMGFAAGGVAAGMLANELYERQQTTLLDTPVDVLAAGTGLGTGIVGAFCAINMRDAIHTSPIVLGVARMGAAGFGLLAGVGIAKGIHAAVD